MTAGCGAGAAPAGQPQPPALPTGSSAASVTPTTAAASATAGLPDCHSADLAVGWFERGDRAGGTDYGWVTVRDVTAQPCRLAGTLRLRAFDGPRTPIGPSVREVVRHPLRLTADATPPVGDTLPPATERLAFVPVGTSTFGPDGTACRHPSTPTRFRIDLPRVGGHVEVRQARDTPVVDAIVVCRGNNVVAGHVAATP